MLGLNALLHFLLEWTTSAFGLYNHYNVKQNKKTTKQNDQYKCLNNRKKGYDTFTYIIILKWSLYAFKSTKIIHL